MGIQVITGATAALAEALADRFAAPADDPFAAEMIVVPTRGIERYLTQTIADRAGISANIEFRSPRELLERITGQDDPWRPDRLVWPLLATIDAASPNWQPHSTPTSRRRPRGRTRRPGATRCAAGSRGG